MRVALVLQYFLLFSLLFSVSFGFYCGESEIDVDKINFLELRNKIQVSQHQIKDASSLVDIRIPIVWHVIYSTNDSSTYLTKDQIKEEIKLLNEWYSARNAYYNNKIPLWDPVVATQDDFHIFFELASYNPEGNPTDGIIYIQNSHAETSCSYPTNFDKSWNTEQYMNIFSCNLGKGRGGYAPLPQSYTDNKDVVRINSNVIGSNYFGGILAHEVGHWLGLLHTFNNLGCDDDDGISDTPNTDINAASYVPIYDKSCGGNFNYTRCLNTVQVQNIMDYTNADCMSFFTKEQVNIMRSFLTNPLSTRSKLNSSPGLSCKPQCENKSCGDDGCGGECNFCPDIAVCTDNFECLCISNCSNSECGNDGCGGSCGNCSVDNHKCEYGKCVCIPDCIGKQCGDDGCGGFCGVCDSNFECNQHNHCSLITKPCTNDKCIDSCLHCNLDRQICSENGTCICIPDCNDKQCGNDGCDSFCGTCPPDYICSDKFSCICSPNCEGKQCGDDNCGGKCGECDSNSFCDNNGSCQCIPNCDNKLCGDDGCGGFCGSCDEGFICNQFNECVCEPNCFGKECGGNGCGSPCNSCPNFGICINYKCEPCVPNCVGKECGDDGCGGYCNICDDPKICFDYICTNNPDPICTVNCLIGKSSASTEIIELINENVALIGFVNVLDCGFLVFESFVNHFVVDDICSTVIVEIQDSCDGTYEFVTNNKDEEALTLCLTTETEISEIECLGILENDSVTCVDTTFMMNINGTKLCGNIERYGMYGLKQKTKASVSIIDDTTYFPVYYYSLHSSEAHVTLLPTNSSNLTVSNVIVIMATIFLIAWF